MRTLHLGAEEFLIHAQRLLAVGTGKVGLHDAFDISGLGRSLSGECVA
jgi:hypothetical protein